MNKIKDLFKKKKKVIISAFVVLLCVVGAIVYALIPETIAVEKVAKGNVQAYVSEVGNISADDAITIYSPVSGKVSDVKFKNYENVAAGDVLATYDLTTFQEGVQAASANKKYYQDGYNAAVSKNNEYKNMLNVAQVEGEANKQIYAGLLESRDELDITKEARAQEIQYQINKLEAQLATLSADLSSAQSELSSAEGDDRDDAQSRVDSIYHQIESNRKAIMSIDTRSMTIEEYTVYLEVLRHLDLIDRFWSQNIQNESIAKQAIVSDSQIAQYSDSIELAKIQETQANRDLEIAEQGLLSSCGGTIVQRLVDPGSTVTAGTPLFVIQPDTGYKVKVMISRFDIGSVAVGQKAEVVIGGTTYNGVVSGISPVAETDSSNKPKVKVFVNIEDSEAKPTIGLEADVKIFTDEKKDVLTVSDTAVYTDDQGSYVYVLEDDVITRKDITRGVSGGGKVEIVDGLSENQQVITVPVAEDEVGSKRVAE